MSIKATVQGSAALVVVAVVLAGCSGEPPQPASTEPVTINFTNWVSAEEANIPPYEAVIEAFEEEYPYITVETTSVPYADIKNSLLVAAAGGEPPDVAQVKEEWLPSFFSIDALAPLQDLLPAEVVDDFVPGLLEASRQGDDLDAVAWGPSVVQLYYNKELMEAAGYGDEPPATWDEMIEMAEDIAALGQNAEGQTVYGVGISDKKLEGTGYFLLPWLWSQGGEVLDESGEVAFDSEENVEALTLVGDLLSSGVAPGGTAIVDLRNLFAQGQLGFYFDVDAAIGINAATSPRGEEFANAYGIAQLPVGVSGEARTFYLQNNLVIFADSGKKEAAAKLIEFLTSPEGTAIFLENGGTRLPARASTAEIDYYASPDAQRLVPFIAALDTAAGLPATNDQFTIAMEALADAIARVGRGDDPQTVVSETSVVLEDAYGN